MRPGILFIVCILILGLALSPAYAGDHKTKKANKKRLTQPSDNIYNYSNEQLTAELKDKTPKEVIARFGFPDRISAKVNKNKKTVYYKYGRTYSGKDRGIVFVNDKVKEVRFVR